MIIEAILNLIFVPLQLLINLLPVNVVQAITYPLIPDPVLYGAYFFPLDCLVFAVTGFMTWYTILMAWAIIEWVYKKIPGVS